MTPIQTAGDLLRSLPRPVRKWIYALWALIGFALTLCEPLGITELGPITVTQALQAYVLISPALGGVAVANTKKPDPEPDLPEPEEDLDLSSFQPIDDNEDIFV